jgi:hypothetical protein
MALPGVSEIMFIAGVGPHPAADDAATARESFRKPSALGFDAACFGHGRPIPSGASGRF